MCTNDNFENSCCDTTILANEVWVNPSKKTILVGTWYEYAIADVYPSNATNKNVIWSSSNENVATVHPSSGRIYGVSAGCATIYATATDGSGCRDCLSLTVVTEIKAEYVSLNSYNIALKKDKSKKICACICPTDATNQDVIWSSNHETVATVDSNGTVYGHLAGTAVITATAADGSGKSASCYATVTDDILVTSIEVSPSDTTLKIGHSIYPTVTVCPTDATDKSVTWSSADSHIASVNPNSGLVYAHAVGTTTIYATACDGSGVCGYCTVRVIPVYVQDVVVCPETLTLDVGESSCLEATVYPANATNPNISWTSGDCNIADVDSNGCVTAKSAGTTYICATAIDGSGAHGCCTVTVNERNTELGNYYNIINSETDKVVNISGSYLVNLSDGKNITLYSKSGSNEQVWKIDTISDSEPCYIKSYIDQEYGFNAYRSSSSNYTCNIHKITGNETDAAVYFISQSDGSYKIKLANYSNYYLTATGSSDGSDIRWQPEDSAKNQNWNLVIVDFDQREAEKIEYHILCNGNTDKALRVGRKNVFNLTQSLPVRGERLSYWNRQKWVIKIKENKKRIYTQLNSEYYLCDDGSNNAYVSNDASDENSEITIIPYDNSNKLYRIKLSQSELYLTLVYNESDDLYWAKWQPFDNDNSNQIWNFVEQPTTNHLGIDTATELNDTTIRKLILSGIKFVGRYYKPITLKNVQIRKFATYKEQEQGISNEYYLNKTIDFLKGEGIKICTKAPLSVKNDIDKNAWFDYIDSLNAEDVVFHNSQNLKLYEKSSLKEYDLNIFSIYQDYNRDIEFFDSRNAQIDALCALICAKFLEQPIDTAIYFAVDANFSEDSDLHIIDKYFEIISELVTARGYKVGVYGSGAICEMIKSKYATFSFLSNSTEYDNYDSYDSKEKYDIKQAEETIFNGVGIDINTAIVENYGQW